MCLSSVGCSRIKVDHFDEAQRAERSSIGEFIASAKADKAFPNIKSWRELRAYLHRTGSINVAAIGARGAWRRYRDEVRTKSKV
jgi:hypothetical protein